MSTEWVKIKSANPNFPNDTLEFVTSLGNTYFFIELDNSGSGTKFWFNKKSWEELKYAVNAVMSSYI